MSSPNHRNVYTNAAFCQQSEFYGKSPPRTRPDSAQQRQPPLGALSPSRSGGFNEDRNCSQTSTQPPIPGPKPTQYVKCHREDAYEEMLVDDSFCIPQKQHSQSTQNIQNSNNGNRYAAAPLDNDQQLNHHQQQVHIKQTSQQIRYVQNTHSQAGQDFNANDGGISYAGDEEVDMNMVEYDERNLRVQKHRYEYIPIQEHEQRDARCKSPPRRPPQQVQRQRYQDQEEIEVAPGVMHRYAVIPQQEQETQFVNTSKGRYALVPVEEVPAASKNRYAVISPEELVPQQGHIQQQQQQKEYTQQQSGRYEYIQDSPAQLPMNPRPQQQQQRPTAVTHISRAPATPTRNNPVQTTVTSPATPRKGNPIATQKLHELLTTPRKTQHARSSSVPRTPQKAMVSPSSPRRAISPIYQQQQHPQQTQQPHQNPFSSSTPNKNSPAAHAQAQRRATSPHIRNPTPKAQQKLNYTLSTRQNPGHPQELLYDTNKRHTAVIAPICSSPVQSVYSETTFSNKTESWMNLSMSKPPVQASLAVASLMMMLCGTVSTGLCFYMIAIMGRLYFLEMGVVAGFACSVFGFLGFRSRNCYWLPNRNYISGYVVLSIFSLLTCAALLLLLFMQPKPGSPWADVTSGAVCGISGLSLLLAASGVIASYCCKYPPPDNRVEHCARGFTV